MIKDKEYWRLKKQEQRAKIKAAKESLAVNPPERPKEATPEQWKVALERAERSRVYAEKLPEQVRPADKRFQNAEWQWWNEFRGEDRIEYAPAVETGERKFIEQHCAVCNGMWNSYTPIECPYCHGKGRKAA